MSIRPENHSFAEVSIQRIEGFIGQDSREFPIGSFSASAISYVPDRQTTLSRHPPDNQITIHANITPDALFWVQEFPPSLAVVNGSVVVCGKFGLMSLPIPYQLQKMEELTFKDIKNEILGLLKG